MEQRVIALGFFDGVHLGHGALLRRTTEEARKRGCASAVFTFDRPPKEVVTGIPCPLINSPEDRRELITRLYGVDEVILAPFDRELMATPWDRYVTELLAKRWHAVHLVAGHDHRFGYKNAGTSELLRAKCAQLGIGCDIIPKVEVDGVTVSSTYIRTLVEQGDLERAARFLGHPHILSGTVRHGRSLGRARLFPTVNLTVPPQVLVPRRGVYVSRVYLDDGRAFPGVTNVGVRPTVTPDGEVTVETYLLDFDGDLYGRQVRLEFWARLRDERRFDSLDALKAQIAADAETVRARFSAPEPAASPRTE
ncbi:MAG: bifunctional riboflavin kinase/FAD synthetase [Oscillibacter sp.]|jgi:riboflavin kinase/FMN adenylyltransferase|nr:bifunctional riboflavin kinase/FAD synthetase [Oscillibacter sp.]